MPVDLDLRLVVGISSRALFDLESENDVFESKGVEAYRACQREREEVLLKPGTAFPLVRALLGFNFPPPEEPKVEVVVMSKNSPDLGLRVFSSIEHFGLDISRAAFTSGASLAPYLDSFSVDLFLSRAAADVQEAVDRGFAAAQIYDFPTEYNQIENEIRIAFDADAVIFSDEAEAVFKADGLEAFLAHERENAKRPLPEGPFARFLKAISLLQASASDGSTKVRLAIVTARNSPAHERVIRTLRLWGVSIDEAFFMGGVPKREVLRTFSPHIFFDDQEAHVLGASEVVPSARVPYKLGSELRKVGDE